MLCLNAYILLYTRSKLWRILLGLRSKFRGIVVRVISFGLIKYFQRKGKEEKIVYPCKMYVSITSARVKREEPSKETNLVSEILFSLST